MKEYKFIRSNGDSTCIQNVIAKSKREAFDKGGFDYIYWKGNTPYSFINNKNVFAIIVK
jgi:hypothetical protein